jgi:pyrroline-5-carboxylate reductase
MKTSIIAIIGGGNMGTNLAGGLIADGYSPEKIWITGTKPEKLEQITKRFGVHTTTSNQEAAAKADILIFAIKPQVFADVAPELKEIVSSKKPLVISVVTGISEATMRGWLGDKTAIVRAMPNTPSLVGAGATALFANAHTSKEQYNDAESVMRAIGIVVWVQEEKLINAVTGLSGSGPAYFFLIMEAMEQAGQELGLSKEVAHLLTLQTAFGAASMALQSDLSLQDLRKQVTSPKGTTEQGIRVLEEAHIRKILKETVNAAVNRAEELAKLFEPSES